MQREVGQIALNKWPETDALGSKAHAPPLMGPHMGN